MAAADRPITIVTGASKGIGAATARRLALAGHDVVLGYRTDEDGVRAVAAEVGAAGGRALPVRADVGTGAGVDELFARTVAEFGTPTGLVNNAGLTAHIGDLAETPIEMIHRVIDVNFTGVVLACRAAALAMSTSRGGAGGAIVNVSSAAATLGAPHEYVHYAAAKAAVDALTIGLSKELGGDGIRVNAVSPGVIRTGIHAAGGDPGRADRLAAVIPLGRPGEPDDVVGAIAWLLGPEAGYVTGAVLRVAGGR
jgi:NAD(P)-dependent dehydrogenase (short-subunit alcohol dehydrogenase family)